MIMSCFQNCSREQLSEAAMACTGAPPGKRPRLDILPFANVMSSAVETDVKRKITEFQFS
jgi:hypothetical protein